MGRAHGDALSALLVATAGLHGVGFDAVWRGLLECPRAATPHGDAAQIGRAVERWGARLPGVRCLPRALAAAHLLRRAGWPCELTVGVTGRPRFGAHAWLSCDGRVVVGGPVPDSFRAIWVGRA